MSWNESIYCLHDSNSLTLTIGIWHEVLGQKDSLFAVGQISTEGVRDNTLQGDVKFENYGTVTVRLEKLQDHPTALGAISNWMVQNSTRKTIKLLVDQVSLLFLMKFNAMYSFRMILETEFMKYPSSIKPTLSKQHFSKTRLSHCLMSKYPK